MARAEVANERGGAGARRGKLLDGIDGAADARALSRDKPVGKLTAFGQMRAFPKNQESRMLALAAIALVSLLVRLAPLIRPGTSWATTPDSVGYIDLANGLAAGCGFARAVFGRCLQAELFRTPGYPLFLAAFPSMRAALAVQAVLGAAVLFISALFAWRWIGITGAFIVAAVLGLDVPSIVASNSLMAESLFTSLVTAAILLQLEAVLRGTIDAKAIAGIFIAGLFIGLAILVRPIGEVLIVLAPLPALFLRGLVPTKRIALALLAVSVVPLVVIAGWSYRNWDRRGIWTFSTIAAINTYYYRAAGVLAYESGRSFDKVQSELLQSTDNSFEALSPEITEELSRRGRAILRSHPGAFCFVTLRGFLKSALSVDWTGPRILLGYEPLRQVANLGISEKISSLLSYPLLSLVLLMAYCLLAFTWAGAGQALWWCLRNSQTRNNALSIIPLFAALLLLVAGAGPEGYDRFRVPVMPMLAIVAASGWTERYRLMANNQITHTHV